MVHKKGKSKRVTLKTKYKIQRKVKDHKKKLRKFARDNPHLARKGPKADPGIPNLWPFKEALLKQQEESREAQQAATKDKRKALIEKRRRENTNSDIISQAPARIEESKKTNETDVSKRRWYYKELKKVVELSDVILEVVDARDPMGCRCLDVERKILAHQTSDGSAAKKLIIVLNKIDLIPPAIASEWVKALKREFPTIAFKSGTQKQKVGLQSLGVKQKHATEDQLQLNACVGGDALLQLLKNYSRSLNMKLNINVGVIGYPNVGKSSVINSLKRCRAVGVSAQPGFTKAVQRIKLDSNISLLDSPGVLFSTQDADGDMVLRNCLKLEHIEDPLSAAFRVVGKCSAAQLMELYSLPAFTSPEHFLFLLAQRRGKLAKGGVPNLEGAARMLLKDWNEAKIPYYTTPPKFNQNQPAEIVKSFSPEFDIEALLEESNKATVSKLKTPRLPFSALEASAPGTLPFDFDEEGGDVDLADVPDTLEVEDDEEEMGEAEGDEAAAAAAAAAEEGENGAEELAAAN